MSRLSAAQPLPQAIPPAAAAGAAGADASDAVAPPARKARLTAPKETRKSSKGVKRTVKRKRVVAKTPEKIPSVHMDHPDWPWPLDLLYLNYPIWLQQKMYRENRFWYPRLGITGPDEKYRADVREWKAENGY